MLKISLNRSMTVSTGQYNFVRPSVEVSLDNINPSKLTEAYNVLSNISDSLMALEFIKLYDEMDSISKVKPPNYFNTLKKHEADILASLDENSKLLSCRGDVEPL